MMRRPSPWETRSPREVHELVRLHSHAVTAGLKEGTATSRDLIERLRSEPVFRGIDVLAELNPIRYVGRSQEQVEEFIEQEVEPIRRRYAGALGQAASELTV